jgi:hypothetical protein
MKSEVMSHEGDTIYLGFQAVNEANFLGAFVARLHFCDERVRP